MIITTKYSVGDHVYAIHQTRVELPPVPCSACGATGKVDLCGEAFHCPKCKGKRETQATGWGWVICDSGEVRDVRAEYGRNRPDDPMGELALQEDDDGRAVCLVVTYMFSDSGSGSLWSESALWPSREAAIAECDRRNGHERAKAVTS